MFFVYILKCAGGTLYVGYTDNVERRLAVHASGKGSKYVRARLPAHVVYREEFATKSLAMKREKELKSWTRQKKQELIQTGDQSREPQDAQRRAA